MAMSPSKRAPLSSLPNKENVALHGNGEKRGSEDKVVEEGPRTTTKGHNKRVLNEHLDNDDKDPAKRARPFYIRAGDEGEGVSAASLTESFAGFEQHQFLGGKSPQIRPVSSSSPASIHLQRLASPSPSIAHSRTVSTSSQDSYASSQDLGLASEGGESSEGDDLNQSQNTVLTEPDNAPLAPLYFPHVAASTGRTRSLSLTERENKQKVASIVQELRIMLTYAKYKVDTQQVDVPLDQLEVRHVSRDRNNKSWFNPSKALDLAIARWEKDRLVDEARGLARTPLPTAPEVLQPHLYDFEFKTKDAASPEAPLLSTELAAPEPPSELPKSPHSRLRDLGFDTDTSADESDDDDDFVSKRGRRYPPYEHYVSRPKPVLPRQGIIGGTFAHVSSSIVGKEELSTVVQGERREVEVLVDPELSNSAVDGLLKLRGY